jgi:hypothetical protein
MYNRECKHCSVGSNVCLHNQTLHGCNSSTTWQTALVVGLPIDIQLAALQAVVWCARPLRRLFLLKQSTQHSLHEDPDRSTGGSGFGGFTSTICISYASPLEPARKNDNCQTLWL